MQETKENPLKIINNQQIEINKGIKPKFKNPNQNSIKNNNSNNQSIPDPIINFLLNYIKSKELLLLINDFSIKYYKSIIINLIFIGLNLIGFAFYEQTLLGCYLSEVECLTLNIIKFFMQLAPYLIIACLIAGITITLSLWGRISIIHIFYIIIKYSLYYKKDHGSTLATHGEYNIMAMGIGVSIIVFVFSLLFLSKRCFKKGYSSIYFLTIILICYGSLNYYENTKNRSQCDGWDITINNTNINKPNSNSECNIILPKTCYMATYYGFFDMSSLMGIECKNCNYKQSRNILLQKLNYYKFKNTLKFGYAITTNDGYVYKNLRYFNKRVLDKTIDMDDKEIISKLNSSNYPEITLEYKDRNYTYAEIKINITKKKELSEYRKKKENPKSPFENVLFLFFDAISRVHFKRALPKTTKFFEKYLKYNPNSKYKTYHFSKYHSIEPWTRINMQGMFYGYYYRSARGVNFLRYYKSNGFISAQSEGVCSKEVFAIDNEYFQHLKFESFDHENIGMFCDPNYYDRRRPYAINKGEYSVLRRCLYGKDVHEYVIDYGKIFWETYKDNRKFLRLGFIEPHEASGEVPKYIDDYLFKFLNYLMNNNLLYKTAVILISDHGLHMGAIYKAMKSDDYRIEQVLPILTLLLHDYKGDDYYLTENQDYIISAYDLYNTLIYLSTGDMIKYGVLPGNIFGFINPKGRNCRTVGINLNVCKCKNVKK